ncbi:MAG: hypothetical protein J7J61_07290 [Candidatus Hydrothermae bacterium]|nr:hypothetical protein [Candidatus Hydrothermae bacterium]
MRENLKKISLLGLFAITMAYLEAAVVVYLRELYYRDNILSLFPLRTFTAMDLRIEIFREFSTLVMLILVSLFAFTQRTKRWAAFFFTWGVWDIFYYVWLKILIGWPVHWTDWDILFLIPVPWLAPFISPVIVALIFIIGGLLVILKNVEKLRREYLLLALIGAVLIFLSFIWKVIFTKVDALYITQGGFPWLLYIAGLILIVGGYILAFRK